MDRARCRVLRGKNGDQSGHDRNLMVRLPGIDAYKETCIVDNLLAYFP